MNYPEDLKYTENDEWVRIEGEVATVGITDFAQDQLSDIVYLEYLVEVGEAISARDAVGTVESVKAASDVYAPVSGEVVAVNEELLESPELVNTDPYGGAWMLKIAMSDGAELDKLMSSVDYQAFNEER